MQVEESDDEGASAAQEEEEASYDFLSHFLPATGVPDAGAVGAAHTKAPMAALHCTAFQQLQQSRPTTCWYHASA